MDINVRLIFLANCTDNQECEGLYMICTEGVCSCQSGYEMNDDGQCIPGEDFPRFALSRDSFSLQ
jgi:hypothetical protein